MTTFPRMAKGFTLIELMIVVAIIAILAAIAYPAYINHVVDTRRTAATACVIEQAQYMERYYTSEMTFAIPRDEFPEFGCEADLADFYDIDFAADPTALAFTIQAVPQGAQLRDTECGTLSLNQVGNRGETGTGTPDDCW